MAYGHWELVNGATVLPDGRVHFGVWAPRVRRMGVRCLSRGDGAEMQRNVGGRHTTALADVGPGGRHYFAPDGPTRPDHVPRSRPAGVH
jgi:1,4-alpha-glucan branching enzyme